MISGSNELLLQELEYTLLKPGFIFLSNKRIVCMIFLNRLAVYAFFFSFFLGRCFYFSSSSFFFLPWTFFPYFIPISYRFFYSVFLFLFLHLFLFFFISSFFSCFFFCRFSSVFFFLFSFLLFSTLYLSDPGLNKTRYVHVNWSWYQMEHLYQNNAK